MQNYNMERMQCHCEDKNPREEERNLAFPYVMWQKGPDMYENLEEAFRIGTIFPALNFPFTGKRK